MNCEIDNERFTELYERTYVSVYRVAYSIIKNEEDACDLLQETYKTVWEKFDTLSSIDKFDKWVIQITANKCKDFLRKKKPNLFSEVESEEENFEDSIPDTSEQSNPDTLLENNEIKEIVKEILFSLPEDQRICLILYYGQDLKISEIASALNISENTVKSRLTYGKKKMKQQIEELENKGTKLHSFAGAGILPLIKQLFLSDSKADIPPHIKNSADMMQRIIRNKCAGIKFLKRTKILSKSAIIKIVSVATAGIVTVTAGIAIFKTTNKNIQEIPSQKDTVLQETVETDSSTIDDTLSETNSSSETDNTSSEEDTGSKQNGSSKNENSTETNDTPSTNSTSSAITSTETNDITNYVLYVGDTERAPDFAENSNRLEAGTTTTVAISENAQNSSPQNQNDNLVTSFNFPFDADDFTNEQIENLYPCSSVDNRFYKNATYFPVLDDGTVSYKEIIEKPTTKTNETYEYSLFAKEQKSANEIAVCVFVIVSYDCDIDNNKRYDVYTTYQETNGVLVTGDGKMTNEFVITTNGKYPLSQEQIIKLLDTYYDANNRDFEFTILK